MQCCAGRPLAVVIIKVLNRPWQVHNSWQPTGPALSFQGVRVTFREEVLYQTLRPAWHHTLLHPAQVLWMNVHRQSGGTAEPDLHTIKNSQKTLSRKWCNFPTKAPEPAKHHFQRLQKNTHSFLCFFHIWFLSFALQMKSSSPLEEALIGNEVKTIRLEADIYRRLKRSNCI